MESDTNPNHTNIPYLSESKNRRLLELRLLHHYMKETLLSRSWFSEQSAVETWATILPGLAFKHDALLYSMYAVAALHLSRLEPENAEAIDAYRSYLGLAIQQHRSDIAQMNNANSDAACLTSTLLRINAFAVLQERPLSPYTPPIQFLQITSGALMVFHAAWSSIENDDSSIAAKLVKKLTVWSSNEPSFEESWKAPFQASNGLSLVHLLRRDRTENPLELWDSDIQSAYQKTVNYIGSVQIAITAREADEDVFRRLAIFPVLIPKKFIDLVMEQQQRALVILAHYFALIARFKHIWYIGDVGRREVRGIQTALSAEWYDMMSWPLSMIEEESS